MAFVSAAEIVTRLGNTKAVQLTTDSGSTVDTDMIDGIVARVEGKVWAALRTRTTATITEADFPQTWAMAQGVVMDIAIFQLHLRRLPVPDDWKLAYNHAIEWLNQLTAGKIDLPDAAANEPGSTYDFQRDDAGAEDMV